MKRMISAEPIIRAEKPWNSSPRRSDELKGEDGRSLHKKDGGDTPEQINECLSCERDDCYGNCHSWFNRVHGWSTNKKVGFDDIPSDFAARYMAGETMAAMADSYGKSRHIVAGWRNRLGLPPRVQGQGKKRKKPT